MISFVFRAQLQTAVKHITLWLIIVILSYLQLVVVMHLVFLALKDPEGEAPAEGVLICH